MKKLFMFLAVSLFAVSAYAAEFPNISVADVNAAVAAKSAVIIDVNGDKSYDSAHIPGALNYFAIKHDLAANLPKDKDALVIAYCGNPACAAYLQAAGDARKLGYTNVRHMSAGIDGWREAGMKTEASD